MAIQFPGGLGDSSVGAGAVDAEYPGGVVARRGSASSSTLDGGKDSSPGKIVDLYVRHPG